MSAAVVSTPTTVLPVVTQTTKKTSRALKKSSDAPAAKKTRKAAVTPVVNTSAPAVVAPKRSSVPKAKSAVVAAPVETKTTAAVAPVETKTTVVTDAEAKAPAVKRVRPEKKSNMESQGIGVNMPRAKNILTYTLNRDECKTRDALKVEQDKWHAETNKSEQSLGPATPVARMEKQYLDVIKRAQNLADDSVRQRYESEVLGRYENEVIGEKNVQDKKVKITKKDKYAESLKEKKEEVRRKALEFDRSFPNSTNNPHKFDLRSFNENFDHKFYDGYIAYVQKIKEDDLRAEYEQSVYTNYRKEKKYADYRNKRNTAETAAYDNKTSFNLQQFNNQYDPAFYAGQATFKTAATQWSQARDLVSKLSIRVSNTTRLILSAFLDQLVVQYIRNAISVCLKNKNKIIQTRNALDVTGPNFATNVSLDKFARTLTCYQSAVLDIINQDLNKMQKAAAKKARNQQENIAAVDIAKESLEKFVDSKDDEEESNNKSHDRPWSFVTYVADICLCVRRSMMRGQTADTVSFLHDMQVSADFKDFCSDMICETIERIGHALRLNVSNGHTKTVSEQLMLNTIAELHALCGVNFEPIQLEMNSSMVKFREWHEKHRAETSAKRKERLNKTAAEAAASE